MCLALKVKKFEFRKAHLGRGNPIVERPILVLFSLFLITAHSENFIHLVETV